MIDYREARPDDVEEIAELMCMAAGAMGEFVLSRLVSGLNFKELMVSALHDESTTFHYGNVLVATMNTSVVGMAHCYPANQHALPGIIQALVPTKRLAILQPIYDSKVQGSYYVNALAVHPRVRRNSIGSTLFQFCEDMAVALGYDCVSAHIWQSDSGVQNALSKLGYCEVEKVAIKPHKLLPLSKKMVLLKSQQLVASDFLEKSMAELT